MLMEAQKAVEECQATLDKTDETHRRLRESMEKNHELCLELKDKRIEELELAVKLVP